MFHTCTVVSNVEFKLTVLYHQSVTAFSIVTFCPFSICNSAFSRWCRTPLHSVFISCKKNDHVESQGIGGGLCQTARDVATQSSRLNRQGDLLAFDLRSGEESRWRATRRYSIRRGASTRQLRSWHCQRTAGSTFAFCRCRNRVCFFYRRISGSTDHLCRKLATLQDQSTVAAHRSLMWLLPSPSRDPFLFPVECSGCRDAKSFTLMSAGNAGCVNWMLISCLVTVLSLIHIWRCRRRG